MRVVRSIEECVTDETDADRRIEVVVRVEVRSGCGQAGRRQAAHQGEIEVGPRLQPEAFGIKGAGARARPLDQVVDQVGTLNAPYGTFPVLRIATDMTRRSGFSSEMRSSIVGTKKSFFCSSIFTPESSSSSR